MIDFLTGVIVALFPFAYRLAREVNRDLKTYDDWWHRQFNSLPDSQIMGGAAGRPKPGTRFEL